MGLKIAAVLGVVILVLLGGFYAYFKYSQDRIQTLMADNAKLETAVKLNEETIKVMKDRAEQQAKQVVELQQGLNEANVARKELEQKFRKHDLDALARENSKALEFRMNRATARVWRDFETMTGGTPDPMPAETQPAPKPDATSVPEQAVPTPPAAPRKKKSTFKTMEEINAQ